MKDLKYAVRSLRRQPAFTIITVLTLVLGIGANTAVFSVVRGVLLRPLPYPQPERLEYITSQFPGLGFNQFWISPPEFVEFRDNNKAFSSVGAYSVGAIKLETTPPSRPVSALVTPELMPTLGVQPYRGRWFTAEDSVPNAPPVAILSHELWVRAFGADEKILGQNIRINNGSEQVVGIMPPGYDVHDSKVEVWRPLTLDPSTFPNRRGNHFLYLVGRLKNDVTREQALADVERLLNQWREIAPAGHVPTATNHRLRVDPLRDDIVGGIKRALVVLQVAVVFVLLIACANLANLLVARADTRVREYSVRTALGASRWQLFRQLMIEGLVLTVPASGIGIALAYLGVTSLIAVSPNAVPRSAEIGLDWAVLGFTAVIAVLTGLVFALVPLMHLGVRRGEGVVRDAGTRSTAGGTRVWVRSILVVAEVALAVTLVVGAGLLIRSFFNLTRVDAGYNRSGLTTFGVVLPGTRFTNDQGLTFYNELTNRLKSISGVQSVAAMAGLPPLRNVNANDTDFEHIPNTRPPGSLPAENVDFWQFVSLGYNDTMGIPLIKGRSFELADTQGAPVVMINEALAHKFFADRDPIGGRIKPGFGGNIPFFTVIGVLKDVKQAGVAEPVGTELYMLTDQMPKYSGFLPRQMNFVVRSSLPLELMAPTYRQIIGNLDPTLPVIRIQSMDEAFDAAIARPRFLTLLLSVFAALALALAAVGTYGVLSYLVAQRTQEIGIRMALGADRSRIMWLVMTRGLLLAAIGLGVGLAGAAAATRVLGSLLYNVTPTDPSTLFLVGALMLLVAAGACFVPAWRATRVDPLVVMRET
jgi:putative ABC transport system permease protein